MENPIKDKYKNYDEFVSSTTQGDINSDPYYSVLGLCGESGEVAEKFKKIKRDKGGVIDENSKEEIVKELGDVLWYITRTALNIGKSLDQVMEANIKKIEDRHNRGVVHGGGDNR